MVQNGEPQPTSERTDAQPRRPPRRLIRYSLRTLLLLHTALCLWLGYIVRRAHDQRQLVSAIEAARGNVRFDYEYDYSNGRQFRGLAARPPGPDWLRELIGAEYFATVVDASLGSWSEQPLSVTLEAIARAGSVEDLYIRDSKVTRRDMEVIRSLPNLRWFTLAECEVRDEDFGILDGHRRLERLSLPADRQWDAVFNGIQDLPVLNDLLLSEGCTEASLINLGRFSKLTTLHLAGRHFTDTGIDQVIQLPTLQRLKLIGTNVSDKGLRRLVTAPELRSVMIEHNRVPLSNEAIDEVRKTIPDLDVLQR